MSLSMNDKLTLLQYAINKYDSENTIKEKLNGILSTKDVERGIDTLIATQRVRRIGPDIIQNNVSHTELPELPDSLKEIVDRI
ncbi:hypothetical protein NWT39_04150 [Nitrososphaera viennensis]|nr:hypothetical protein [Nitrososphaera viennensis]UVS69983.1 hypothetical protein NWT39_04150 [Nitrososphaera viennensis]